MAVASHTPCQACTHDGVLDTQPSAGTLDTHTDLRLPPSTAARTKIKHPRSERAGCDRLSHHREENLRHRPIQALVNGATHRSWNSAFTAVPHAMRSHAATRTLALKRTRSLYMHLGVRVLSNTAPDTTHAHQPTLCSFNNVKSCWNRCVKGECHQRDSVEKHAVLITRVALRDLASALAPSSSMMLRKRLSSVMATLA